VSLRPGRPDELGFIRRVHRAAMGPHIERVWGEFDEDTQRARLETSTDPEAHDIIELDGHPVGCRWVRRHDEALELVRLWLLPEAQGSGIGSGLVVDLLDEARAARLPVRLRVLKQNPARRLYERHGFRVVEETDTHYRMRAPAPARA
jgi:ribosomal protein S18 acetylase RimI-like enzyme